MMGQNDGICCGSFEDKNAKRNDGAGLVTSHREVWEALKDYSK